MSTVVEIIDEKNFEEVVENSSEIFLLEFGADWCGPCKMMEPNLEEFAKQTDKVRVGKIDIDKSPSLGGKFRVLSIPVLILVKGKDIIANTLGLRAVDQIESFVNEHIS